MSPEWVAMCAGRRVEEDKRGRFYLDQWGNKNYEPVNGHKTGNDEVVAKIYELLGGKEIQTEPTETDERALDGATFVLDQDASLTPRWGREGEVLWAKGESLILVGPAGVGKTTIALQVVAGLLGFGDAIGFPVMPAAKVLYLAMDRPSQIRRAMRRIFGEEHREALASRLVVWPRPIPADLGKHPEMLAQLAKRFGCDVVVIDSVKDAAVKITDDEVGGNFNRALQYCLADGIDVFALHHQRKGQQGNKPTTLEDVYGSTWITAGAGSVVLVWGEAGSETVELTHLKQPSDPVGPLRLEHDHHAGQTSVSYGWDALAYLRMVGTAGATIADAATAEHVTAVPSEAKRKKTERKLRGLVARGLARQKGQRREEDGRMSEARWWAVDPDDIVSTVDTTVENEHTYPSADRLVDVSTTTVDANPKEAGQTVDASVDTPLAPPTVDIHPPLYKGGDVSTGSGSNGSKTPPEENGCPF